MSSSDSETLISTSIPISELMKHIKNSFLERHFAEVQNVLTEREKAMKLEIENLKRDRDSARKELRLIEIEKSRTEGKLHKLEETITRLLKEKSAYTKDSESIKEKNELIAKLKEEINELKNRMGQEIEDLRHERLAATRSVLELKRKNLEANRTIDELRLKKSEADKVELNRSRLDSLAPRIVEIEELLADILNVNVGDLAGLAGEVCNLAKASEDGANVEYHDFRGKNDSFGNVSTFDNAKDEVVKLAGCGSIGLSRKGSGYSGAPSLMSGDITEIPDSDDETNTTRPPHISSRGLRANAAENETNFEKLVQSPSSSSQSRSKRDRTDSGDDFLADSIVKRMRMKCTSRSHDDNNNNVSVDTKTPLQKFNGLNDEVSSDSDDSCSESTINDLITSLGSNKHRKK
ncbi:hypothetical protein CASFOL_036791 [Castilleja foliolosa]|uniref:Uncharacterized protein n=1 Tax=Castilleja foliolosa TaxID=1961234 RepID=A0ABD3BNZ1_9LAMI